MMPQAVGGVKDLALRVCAKITSGLADLEGAADQGGMSGNIHRFLGVLIGFGQLNSMKAYRFNGRSGLCEDFLAG